FVTNSGNQTVNIPLTSPMLKEDPTVDVTVTYNGQKDITGDTASNGKYAFTVDTNTLVPVDKTHVVKNIESKGLKTIGVEFEIPVQSSSVDISSISVLKGDKRQTIESFQLDKDSKTKATITLKDIVPNGT